jgi:Flp pilus assembly protein TadD
MNLHRAPAWLLVAAVATTAGAISASAQESKPTIRHHRVEETVPDDSSSPEVDQAETAMQHNDLATAEALLQKAVAAKPGDYRAWVDLGYVYNATQRRSEAIDAYRKAVAAKPDVFESNLNLGLLLARQGDSAEAAKYLKAATQLQPSANPQAGLARAWQALGRVLQSGDPPQALAAYAEAAALNPKDAEPHLSSAALLQKQGKLDAAAKEYQAAAELDPKSQEALAGLVNLYVAQKKYADAETVLRKLHALCEGQ